MQSDDTENLRSSDCSVRLIACHEFTQQIIRRLRRLEWVFCDDNPTVMSESGFAARWIKHGGDVYCIVRGGWSGEWDAIRVDNPGETTGEFCGILTGVLRGGDYLV